MPTRKKVVTNKGHNYNTPTKKRNISSPPPKEKGGEEKREAILTETKKKANNGQKNKSQPISEKHSLQSFNLIQCSEAIHALNAELFRHKEAIRFLLSNSKQFQNEIQNEKFKKKNS